MERGKGGGTHEVGVEGGTPEEKAETGAKALEAKKFLELADPGRAKEVSSPRGFGESTALKKIPIWHFWLPE